MSDLSEETEPQKEALLATIQQEVKRQNASNRMRLLRIALSLGVVYLFFSRNEEWSNWLCIAWFSSLFFFASHHRKRRKQIVSDLAATTDIWVIPALCDALDFHHDIVGVSEMQAQAMNALTGLLGGLHASDAALLNRKQRINLYETLIITRDYAFALALLSALQQIGDSEAIPFVETLAYGNYLASTNKAVKQAATECLGYLQAHAGEIDAQQLLLRASHEESAPSEQLLRPVATQATTPSDHLLRLPAEE